MQTKKIDISIVIVNYKTERELRDCITSIIKSKPKTAYEIIVVDNDVESEIEKDLIGEFPKIKYIKSKYNFGYGGGNNLGARYALGKSLFFLNPDTKVFPGTLDNLFSFLSKNNKAGIISPVFLDNNLKLFKSQGSAELTPKNILFSQSFLRKIFSDKNIYNHNALNTWDMKNPIKVDTIPGAAMMINSCLFKKIGGFDDKIFLYFEENDISKRISNSGYWSYIVPSAKIIHLIGRSTSKANDIIGIYSKSRYFYLKKHYGIISALLTQMIFLINRTTVILVLTLILAFLIRVLNIENGMRFIGDQGWFYLSARDMLIRGQIPLVGIASSHPWLHQGPLWTYMLAGTFWLFGFNPLNGAYLTIVMGVFSVLLIYFLSSEMFSGKVGLISAIFYATSPLAVAHSRMPYHTSPIPFFTLLFILSLYKWINREIIFFPLTILLLAILYNLELANFPLFLVFLSVLIYGIWKKKEWIKKLINKKILGLSVAALITPMIPFLIYDLNHGFPQTLGFIIWIGYRVIKLFGFPGVYGDDQLVRQESILIPSFNFYQNLIFVASSAIALAVLLASVTILIIKIYDLFKRKIRSTGFVLLLLWLFIPLAGYFVNQTFSDAYLPILFPAFIILTAFSFNELMKIKMLLIPVVTLIILIVTINSYNVGSLEYSSRNADYSKRLLIAKKIVKKANGRSYSIVGIGDGSQFESFTMNYEYLTWWLGHPPAKTPQRLKYIIQENKDGISLIENE